MADLDIGFNGVDCGESGRAHDHGTVGMVAGDRLTGNLAETPSRHSSPLAFPVVRYVPDCRRIVPIPNSVVVLVAESRPLSMLEQLALRGRDCDNGNHVHGGVAGHPRMSDPGAACACFDADEDCSGELERGDTPIAPSRRLDDDSDDTAVAVGALSENVKALDARLTDGLRNLSERNAEQFQNIIARVDMYAKQLGEKTELVELRAAKLGSDTGHLENRVTVIETQMASRKEEHEKEQGRRDRWIFSAWVPGVIALLGMLWKAFEGRKP